MPIILSDPRSDTIVQFLRGQSGGCSLEQIRRQFSPPIPSRTLHRLLTSLAEIGVLTAISGRRYRRYALRLKPGPLGASLWVSHDSNLGAQIADAQKLSDRPKRQLRRASSESRVKPGAATSVASQPNVGRHLSRAVVGCARRSTRI